MGQILIPNESVPDITSFLNATVQQNAKDSSINKPLGALSFYNKVKTGGVWDFKNDPNSPYYSVNYSNGFVFDGEKVTSDFPGNYNFGYTGNSTWWGGQTFLLVGAGKAQVISNAKSGSSQNWGTPFMDNPGDTEQIMEGILYRQNGY